MNVYTVRGSTELDSHINADMERIAEAAAPHSLAGILIGGYGRGEGTPFIHPDGSQSPFNDYDLVVVVERLDNHVREHFRILEKDLSNELGLPVDLCPYALAHLRRCACSLLNYEMKYGHKIIWGDGDILAALPDYPPDSIPLFEGSRLLLNRGKLLLDIRQRLNDPQPLDEEERIRFIKFIHKILLAFGDCALLAASQYDISYTVKKSRIAEIHDLPDRNFVIEGYLKAIALKEWGDYHALAAVDLEAEFNIVRSVFLRFFPWYRALYSTRECSTFKAVALNLQWNRCPLPSHPRIRLYDALQEFLHETPDRLLLGQILSCSRNLEEKFYALHARFS